MNLIAVLLIIVYAIVGGVSTVILTAGLPGIIIWKIYRKVRYHTSLTD